jgi:hypothetical protein
MVLFSPLQSRYFARYHSEFQGTGQEQALRSEAGFFRGIGFRGGFPDEEFQSAKIGFQIRLRGAQLE